MSGRRLVLWLGGLWLLSWLAGCGQMPDIWVDRLEIEVHEDQSARVRIIVLESEESINSDTEAGNRPVVQGVEQEWVAPCVAETHPYLAVQGASGFIATADFATKGDLEHALSCIPVLAGLVQLYPLQVEDRFLARNYRLQIDLMPETLAPQLLLRQVQVTLPGKMQAMAPNAAGLTVNASLPSSDTILWQIASEMPAEAAPPTLSLVAESRQSEVTFDLVLKGVGVLFGSGLLVTLLRAVAGRLKQRRPAAGA